jgi:hypothetical protein
VVSSAALPYLINSKPILFLLQQLRLLYCLPAIKYQAYVVVVWLMVKIFCIDLQAAFFNFLQVNETIPYTLHNKMLILPNQDNGAMPFV